MHLLPLGLGKPQRVTFDTSLSLMHLSQEHACTKMACSPRTHPFLQNCASVVGLEGVKWLSWLWKSFCRWEIQCFRQSFDVTCGFTWDISCKKVYIPMENSFVFPGRHLLLCSKALSILSPRPSKFIIAQKFSATYTYIYIIGDWWYLECVRSADKKLV